MEKFEVVGKWWNDKNIELVKIDNEVYALNNWNGESYLNCWKCSGKYFTEASKEEYIIIPKYEEIEEENFQLIGYEVI